MDYLNTITKVLLIGGVLFYSTNIFAQNDSLLYDISTLRIIEPRLNSNNPSNLKYLPINKISEAEFVFNKTNGNFVNYYQSNNSLSYNLNTESYYRLNKIITLSGKLNYNNFKGKNMGGSVFIDPYKNPFDIVEFNSENQGTKGLETYNLAGAISGEVSKKLTVGGRIEYEAANYAKYKDLRHTNTLLDMNVAIGVLYKIYKNSEIGLNYKYNRRIESISFNTFGNVDKDYLSLISYGAFYGRTELFGSGNFTDENSITPLKNTGQGLGLQFNQKITDNINFNNEFAYESFKGYYGNKGTSDIIFTEHKGNTYSYNGSLSLKNVSVKHIIGLNISYTNLKNFENVYNIVQNSGESSRVIYYGQSEILNQNSIYTKLDLNSIFNSNKLFYYHLNLGALFYRKIQTVTLYPLFRDQEINNYGIFTSIKKNIKKGKNQLGYKIGLEYHSGFGNVFSNGYYTIPSSSQVLPKSADELLFKEFEYFTSPNARLSIGFNYHLALKNNITSYLKIENTYIHAFETVYNGTYNNSINLAIGCSF